MVETIPRPNSPQLPKWKVKYQIPIVSRNVLGEINKIDTFLVYSSYASHTNLILFFMYTSCAHQRQAVKPAVSAFSYPKNPLLLLTWPSYTTEPNITLIAGTLLKDRLKQTLSLHTVNIVPFLSHFSQWPSSGFSDVWTIPVCIVSVGLFSNDATVLSQYIYVP